MRADINDAIPRTAPAATTKLGAPASDAPNTMMPTSSVEQKIVTHLLSSPPASS
jgi:hypothetical protein